MCLIDELRDKSNKIDNDKQEVIVEIKNYFDEYLWSCEFEKKLKLLITDDDIANRKTSVSVEYDNYYREPGIYCGFKKWKTPDGYYYYKGIHLEDIHDEICCYLETRLLERMKELGFNYIEKKDNGTWKGSDCPKYYFGW